LRIAFSASVEYGPHGREHTRGDDLAGVSRADLRWYYFLGSLRISQEEIDISPPWTWIPLFDAMYSVRHAMRFAEGHEALGTIDFTENDEAIIFTSNNGQLTLAPSYLEGSDVACSVAEFLDAGSLFIRSELTRVISRYPSLTDNPHVRALGREVGLKIPA
jgi:hypothetical protein